MKPEGRSSFRYSFRRSFRRKKVDEENEKSPEEVKAEQEKAFAELKTAVADILDSKYDDDAITRFLKARDYDVKEAEKLLRTHSSSWKLFDLDNMKEEDINEVAKKHCFTGLIGFDKEGSLVRIINYGSADLMGFVNSISTVDILKLLVYFIHKDLDRMKEENEKTGRNAKQILYIGNVEHLSTGNVLQKPVIDTELFALKLFQDYFYDIVKSIYIIKAPAIFSTVFKMIKPGMGENLRKRIKILPNDKWKEILLEQIDADVLPAHFGGTRVDDGGDPKCMDVLCYGGEVPRTLFPNKKALMKTLTKVTVEAGDFFNLSVPVKEANSTIKCSVMSKEHDLNLALFFEPSNAAGRTPKIKKKGESKDAMSHLEQLTPFVRCQSHIRPVECELRAFKPGTYIFHIDNTYSWVNPKEVYYKFEVEPPKSAKKAFDLITKTSKMTMV